jgi:hypothetical protein
MKGIPAHISTRKDLQNLFALAQENKIDRAELARKIHGLLALQYYRVPVIERDKEEITTPYFPEAAAGGTTIEGYAITDVTHIESEAGESLGMAGAAYGKTVITLSAEPDDMTVLSVYKEDNELARNGFDIAEINYILGVLENE